MVIQDCTHVPWGMIAFLCQKPVFIPSIRNLGLVTHAFLCHVLPPSPRLCYPWDPSRSIFFISTISCRERNCKLQIIGVSLLCWLDSFHSDVSQFAFSTCTVKNSWWLLYTLWCTRQFNIIILSEAKGYMFGQCSCGDTLWNSCRDASLTAVF